MFLKYFLLIIISFKSTYSQQNKNNTAHILGYNKTDVNFSVPSVSSSLIFNRTANSSHGCFIQCVKPRNMTCKSFVFKINESGNNCFLYNKTFDVSKETVQKENSYLVLLVRSTTTPITPTQNQSSLKPNNTSNYFLILS